MSNQPGRFGMRERFPTAETQEGREAITKVMQASYAADLAAVPPAWATARVVDGEPVSFILVDPHRAIAYPGGDVPYAFICDVATREDRRREGHFRALMQETFRRLREAGIPWVFTHGRFQLYRRFDFEVFTHHSGLWLSPAQIRRALPPVSAVEGATPLTTLDSKAVHEDLLVVTGGDFETTRAARTALLQAAALAERRGKARILFEHPPAPSYGSRYPIHPTLETPLTRLARTCGARHQIQGAAPEQDTVPDADWIKILDAPTLMRALIATLRLPDSMPKAALTIETEAGAFTLDSNGTRLRVMEPRLKDEPVFAWPAGALAQLVTGYRTAAELAAMHGLALPDSARVLLDACFPPRWRLSRNESWTYAS